MVRHTGHPHPPDGCRPNGVLIILQAEHLQEIAVAVPWKGYNPLEHIGALKRLSSEKITAASIMAIA
eukprot:6404114-Prorocentrum_lima.AAC.1